MDAIRKAVEMIGKAHRPIFYRQRRHQLSPAASQLLRELVKATGYPITSTLMGLVAYPARTISSWACWKMHGTLEDQHGDARSRI